jgi:hypothetical protein
MLWALLLLLFPLALRWFGTPEDGGVRWRWRVDAPLCVGLGLLSALVATTWSAPRLSEHATMAMDFDQVCTSAASLASGMDLSVLLVRQPGAALLPSLLVPHWGILDGLLIASTLCSALLGAGLFLWGFALHGRSAGVVAALCAPAVAPLAVLPRHLTFYPEGAAGVVLCAALTALALRFRSGLTLLLAGVGIGLALFTDHPGLLYALVAFPLALVVVFLAPWRWWAPRLLLLLLPIVLSHQAARQLFPPETECFEAKLDAWMGDVAGLPLFLEAWDPEAVEGVPGGQLLQEFATHPRLLNAPAHRRSCWVWGWAPLSQIPSTLATGIVIGREEPNHERIYRYHPELQGRPLIPTTWIVDHAREQRGHQIDPWLWLGAGCLPVLLWGLRRRRWHLVGQLLLFSPFVVGLAGAWSTQVWAKSLMGPMAMFPVLLGAAWAILAGSGAGPAPRWRPRPERPRPAWTTPLLSGVLLLLLVFGVIPSWLSPGAGWRVRLMGDNQVAGYLEAMMLEYHGASTPPELMRVTDDVAPEELAGMCRNFLAWDRYRGRGARLCTFCGKVEGPR